ncbi:MAG TPA: hypothetical protein VLT59_08395, partial [Steroidobacteraceae bacterium]|nr:hypothetical protein [Steroidobacteraceae bacterium]
LFHYPWRGTGYRRRYLLGCLKAFLKAGFERSFYNLGKVGYWGPQTRKSVDFHFDTSKTIAPAQMDDWAVARERAVERKKQLQRERDQEFPIPIKVCGGGPEAGEDLPERHAEHAH